MKKHCHHMHIYIKMNRHHHHMHICDSYQIVPVQPRGLHPALQLRAVVEYKCLEVTLRGRLCSQIHTLTKCPSICDHTLQNNEYVMVTLTDAEPYACCNKVISVIQNCTVCSRDLLPSYRRLPFLGFW